MAISISGKEKILLFLLDHLESQLHPPTKGPPPVIFSASAIPELINISQPLFFYSGETLIKEGWIEKKRYHVPETGRYRDFYFLTAEGIPKAKKLQEEIGKRKIKVRHKDETKEIKIKSLLEHLRKIAKKPIEEGNSYLIKGEKPGKAYEIFKDLLGEGHKGVVLTDILPKSIKKEYKIKVEMYWFSEVEGENVLRPDRLEFEPTNVISNFLKRK